MHFIGKEQHYSLGLLVDGCDVSTGRLSCVGDILLKKVFFHKVGDNNLILANLQTEGREGSRSLPYLICLLENNCGITKRQKVHIGETSDQAALWVFWFPSDTQLCLFSSFVFLPNSFGCCCLLPVSILLLWPLLFPAFLAGLFLLPS